jgi:hypothetical protein
MTDETRRQLARIAAAVFGARATAQRLTSIITVAISAGTAAYAAKRRVEPLAPPAR